jgi:hypothetical protein
MREELATDGPGNLLEPARCALINDTEVDETSI